jgi:hypothetical protein
VVNLARHVEIEAARTLVMQRALNDPEPRPVDFDDALICIERSNQALAGLLNIQIATAKVAAGIASRREAQRAEIASGWSYYTAGRLRALVRRLEGKGLHLERAMKELIKLDRYYRQALARQKKAIRGLEEAFSRAA